MRSGVGSMSHLSFELLQMKTGIKLNGVPYKGGAPMVTDLLGGHLPLAANLVSNFIQLEKDKKVRMLAVASSRRMAALPDVPTVQEQIGQAFEASAWFALTVRAGTPVIYGGFTSNVDMRTGAPSFGTPEYVRATIIGGQLARRWKLPYRASNVNASNSVDAQATYESAMSLWACILSHTNMVHHATGWLEGGLVASMEKAIIDAEMIDTMRAWLAAPLDVSDEALAFDAIREVPPGGHYFGASHTMGRFETAFHRPMVSDVKNYQGWVEAGSLTATQREDNVRGAFRVPDAMRARVAGKPVLLVDDVYTSGATAKAATRALLRAGAGSVDVLTFARVTI